MPDLLLIVPTRGRRANVERMLAAIEATRQADTDVMLVTDDDDPVYGGLAVPEWAWFAQGHRDVVSIKVNRHAAAAARYRYLMFSGDDHVPETPGWDGHLIAAAGDGMAYPDTCSRIDIPEAWLVASPIVSALGWLYPPFVSHFYADNVWGDLGNRTGSLAYAREVIWRHCHHALMPGRVDYDDTYKGVESLGAADREAWEAWRRDPAGMAADIATVQSARAFS